jgi:pilus assembly protein CpaC
MKLRMRSFSESCPTLPLLCGALALGALLLCGTVRAAAPADMSVVQGEGRIVRFEAPVDSVFVANDVIADVKVVAPGVVYLVGKKHGSTNLVALDRQAHTIANIQVHVDAGAARATGGGMRVDDQGRRVVGHGQARDIGDAVDLNAMLVGHADTGQTPVNLTTVASSTQVNIRVRFAEVARDELTSYGVNWNTLFSAGNFNFGFASGGTMLPVAGATNIASGAFTSASASIDVLLDALQRNGVVQILAEPNITTVTGHTASFLAGGEIPVPVPVNRDLVGIEYKTFGVSLSFTPTLLPDNRIALDVKPEVSSLSSVNQVTVSGYNVPSFQVRRADTRVEVGSGQTFAIAGLFQRSNSNDVEKIPLLGDLPIIGALFRSRRYQSNETELVILITPYLVEPTTTHTLATPMDAARAMPGQAIATAPAPLRLPTEKTGFYVD